MSLNLNKGTLTATGAYDTSPAYTDAVDDAQLVRTLGIIALIGGLLVFVGEVAVIACLVVILFGGTTYFRVLGLTGLLLGGVGYFTSPVYSVAGIILVCAGVMLKGGLVLRVLATQGKGDPDWQPTRSRALLGSGLSTLSLLCGLGWLLLYFLATLAGSR